MKELGIQGKVAIITGATSGIGKASAFCFAREGATIALVARNEKELKEVMKSVKNLGAEVEIFPTDLTQEDDVECSLKQIAKQFGGIDILVNSAGIIANGTIENTSLEGSITVLPALSIPRMST